MKPKDNPFASHRVESLVYRFQAGRLENLVDRIEHPGFRGAIVGPKGNGKSTLLEEIAASLKTRGRRVRMLRLSENGARISALWAVPAEVVLLDGAEQLRPIEWWIFRWRTRHAHSLLITTHRPGRLPTLHRCETTPALLSEIVGQLLGPEFGVAEKEISALFARHRGDIRQSLRECYDRAAA